MGGIIHITKYFPVSALIFLSILVNLVVVSGLSAEDGLVKRTVMILPFINLRTDENNYIADVVYDALRSSLSDTDNFNLIESGVIREQILESGVSLESLVENELVAASFASILNADVVVFGKFAVRNGEMHISVTAYDIFYSKSVAVISINGSTGLTLFDTIHTKVAADMADKMSRELKMVDTTLFEELLSSGRYIIEEENQVIINQLLEEPARYKPLTVKAGAVTKLLAVPRGYHVLVLVRDQPGIYQVEVDNERLKSASNGIKMIVFSNKPGSERHLVVSDEGAAKIDLRIVQRSDSEITVKHIRFAKDKTIHLYRRYSKLYMKQAIVFSSITALLLTSSLVTMGITFYTWDSYWKTPLDQPSIWLQQYNTINVLMPVMITFYSVTVASIVPMVIFWVLYKIGRSSKREISMLKPLLELGGTRSFILGIRLCL